MNRESVKKHTKRKREWWARGEDRETKAAEMGGRNYVGGESSRREQQENMEQIYRLAQGKTLAQKMEGVPNMDARDGHAPTPELNEPTVTVQRLQTISPRKESLSGKKKKVLVTSGHRDSTGGFAREPSEHFCCAARTRRWKSHHFHGAEQIVEHQIPWTTTCMWSGICSGLTEAAMCARDCIDPPSTVTHTRTRSLEMINTERGTCERLARTIGETKNEEVQNDSASRWQSARLCCLQRRCVSIRSHDTRTRYECCGFFLVLKKTPTFFYSRCHNNRHAYISNDWVRLEKRRHRHKYKPRNTQL